ncbi:hypothetical protein PSHT_09009 [Puccinia striiformis]|uniref:PWI domain-containing protein n=1 Tax=Puccinia striiformis TaxID=27350 RepID=A0A2S4VJH8_9BASI|nr:hypothetical protein PSHT_09009 [Puccinia striiformis]
MIIDRFQETKLQPAKTQLSMYANNAYHPPPNGQQQPPPAQQLTPGHPTGFGLPPNQSPPSSQPQSQQQQQQHPHSLQPGIPPPFQHLPPPPPGFPHLHPPPHLAPPAMMPQHQFPHQPPPGSYFPPPNRHAGLGSHPQPHNIHSAISPPLNLPSAPNLNQTLPASSPNLPSRPAPTEIYSLFVGSIAEGVDDAWLERLLGCAGHLVSLRRIRDPNGKPKPFGFAEYGDPESVLRCLKVVHGSNLPIDGGRAGEKTLMIKPDDKTKARLDAYEANRIKTDQDNELDTQAIERLEGLISQMKDPDIVAATAIDPNSSINNSNNNSKKNSAAHLQDLAPEDLPEESRGTITREIQFFRERAISKRGEAEKAAKERERGHRDSGTGSSAGPRGYNNQNGKAGYGSSNSTPMGPRGTPNGSGSTGGNHDPQSSNRPMGFVRAGQMAAAKQGTGSSATDGIVPLTDEEEEKSREERKKRMNHLEFKDRERRWETRERNRAQTNQREQQREKSLREEESRIRSQLSKRLENWDDQIEINRGKELFYSNRLKWRNIRKTLRLREEKSDRIDQELEEEELEQIRKESEDFLNKQAEMIAKIQEENRKAGFASTTNQSNGTQQVSAVNGNGSHNGVPTIPMKKESNKGVGLLGNAEEDEDGFKKKRALIPLTYDDEPQDAATKINIRFGKGLLSSNTTVLSEEAKKIKIKEIVNSVPNDKDGLWKVEIKWEHLTDTIIDEKLKGFANKKIIDYLGIEEEELVVAIIDHIRAKKNAQGLVDELEPVLAEEAEEFVVKFWRMLVFEIRVNEAGLSSSSSSTIT